MAESSYDPKSVEARWQARWDERGTNRANVADATNPYYVLMMFPYPSAEGLHVGNVFAFTGADIHGRYKRLRGFDVFEPLGFDAFGIHSENFAMKVGRHPGELIPANIANFTRQLKSMGFMTDWNHAVDTTSPEYYKWTQWVFLQLYKAGLAYRDTKEVNFCPECGTVIADEQVIDGRCERHGETEVQRRAMPCWFFRITKFADRLERNLEWIDWSERTKLAQRNWIGRSEGAEIDFQVSGSPEKIRVFTTRPDTLFGATFMVLAPDHPAVDRIASERQKGAVEGYREALKGTEGPVTESKDGQKTGVFTGAFAVNPATGENIPVWISDYVLMGYGTGAIMAVPSGDHRDFAFADKFGLPVRCIIEPEVGDDWIEHTSSLETVPASEAKEAIAAWVSAGRAAWSGPGRIVNSSNAEVSLDGMEKEAAFERMVAWLEQKGLGHRKTTFRLRDWGISRQRYWGPPIPIIYDEEGNPHPVPEDQLPVALPPTRDFRPKGDGRGPLANIPEFVHATLPDGRPGRRETDVMDNFLDSAWYFIRYLSARDGERAWDPELARKWLPVDMYIGGNEHAVLHLLYVRFLCMALEEAGALQMGGRTKLRDAAEPFVKFRAHGLLIRNGAKMSKSKGNVVNPDELVEKHGADTLRMYLMFLGPYLQGGDFRDTDIMGIRRFLSRVHAWYADGTQETVPDEQLPKALRVKLHQTIRKVGDDLESLSYNTAIAALMELFNEAKDAPNGSMFLRESFAIMLAPLAPHFAEEVWHEFLGHGTSIFDARWPQFDPALCVADEVELAVQINSRVRGRIVVPRESGEDAIRAAALGDATIKGLLDGKEPVRAIVVPGRLVNLIVK